MHQLLFYQRRWSLRIKLLILYPIRFILRRNAYSRLLDKIFVRDPPLPKHQEQEQKQEQQKQKQGQEPGNVQDQEDKEQISVELHLRRPVFNRYRGS